MLELVKSSLQANLAFEAQTRLLFVLKIKFKSLTWLVFKI